MIGLIATLQIQSDKTAEFEKAFARLASEVKANEPGNHLYRLCKSRTEADTYKVMEIYADDEALKAHGSSAHFRSAGLAGFLAGAPTLEYLDTVD